MGNYLGRPNSLLALKIVYSQAGDVLLLISCTLDNVCLMLLLERCITAIAKTYSEGPISGLNLNVTQFGPLIGIRVVLFMGFTRFDHPAAPRKSHARR